VRRAPAEEKAREAWNRECEHPRGRVADATRRAGFGDPRTGPAAFWRAWRGAAWPWRKHDRIAPVAW